MTTYDYTWTCLNCGTKNEERLTKHQAAFFYALKMQRGLKCRTCGGWRSRGAGLSMPDPDDPELLQAWMANKKLFFLEQDEDLFLESVHAETLVTLLRDDATPRHRQGILFSALVHKVHDGRYSDDDDERTAKAYLEETRTAWFRVKGIPFQIRRRVERLLDAD